MKAKFQTGDRVHYTTKRLSGTITKVFHECGDEELGYRYYVKTKQYIWSVPEHCLEMQTSPENSPVNSSVENEQNGSDDAA